jgi:tRNA pseudouridine38-40 synthase
VQGVLADALRVVLRLPQAPALTVAGRTDAGVHARGQVCHLDVAAECLAALPGRSARSAPDALVDRLAGVLPAALVVRRARVAPDQFDARFSALSRSYAYRLGDERHRPDPLRRDVAWTRRRLDVESMHEAAQPLLGEHDFVAYCRPRPGASTVRTLRLLSCRRDSDLVRVDCEADAFCHHQVRALVGALLAVGSGARPVGWPADVLAARRRDGAVQVAPAPGLTLERVCYPDDAAGLAAQATRARRVRDGLGG